MRFPGNCFLVALLCGGSNVRLMRNRRGRVHFYWVRSDGQAYEFYKKGASQRGYLRNALYVGEIRPAPALNEDPFPGASYAA
jgi:hypothetical protein